MRVRARCLYSIAGLVLAFAGLATYPLTASAATIANGITLASAPQASIVFDRNNRPVFTFFRERRTDVPLDHVSAHLIDAVLAIEDRRFFNHHGVDFIRMFGAAWADVRAGRLVEGGSSITQQLVRIDALTQQRTLERKATEALMAISVERRFTKRQILEAYLNRVYFGDGYYGVEAAARGYFGKPASELSVAEAAAIAGVIKSPTAFALRDAPARAVVRRNRVLRAMRDNGSLTADAARDLERAPLTTAPPDHDELAESGHDSASYCGLYFKEEIRRLLLKRFGADTLYQGGLHIYTTFDPDLQRAGEHAIADRIHAIESAKGYRRDRHLDALEGSLVAIDPMTGYVLALVGGRDYHESRFNRATQAHRQPGSAFKPVLFAAALDKGFTPSSVITNLAAPIPVVGGDWLPKDEHGDAASYTLRRALTVSSNRAAAQLIRQVGVASTIDTAKRMGITTTLAPVPSLAIGSGEVTLLDLTSAYSAFANGGMVAAPAFIRRVEDRAGNIVWEARVSTHRAITEETAFLISSMLSDVILRGTGAAARSLGFTRPAAGKTGTTGDFRDVWFVGYTPHLVAGVWFGFDTPSKIMNEGFAATVAVPAWTAFMKPATARDKPDAFKVPADVRRVTLCRLSGQLATDECRAQGDTYDEYVVAGTPLGPCKAHRPAPPPPPPPDTSF